MSFGGPLYVYGGHPAVSPLHNGSAVDVALLVESFSTLGGHCVNAFCCVLYVLLPLYMIALEAIAARKGERFGSAITRALHETLLTFTPPPSPNHSGALQQQPQQQLTEEGAVTSPCLNHGVRHMAVIMDGNRRYGKKHFGSGLKGHEAGGDALLRFILWSKARRVPMLTVYAFSTENWNRSAVEVAMLMTLFRSFFTKIRADAATHSIRIRFIVSDAAKLAPDIVNLMTSVEAETQHYNGIVVNVCVSYSGRASLLAATQRLHAAGTAPTEAVLRAELSRSLCETAPDLTAAPRTVAMADGTVVSLDADPDVLFRTSCEQRLSNFMLYELAYAEMFFVEELWPEVTEATVDRVLRTFASGRDRRFGK